MVDQLVRLGRREAARQVEAALAEMHKRQALEDDYLRIYEHARARSLAAVEHYAMCLAQLEVVLPVEMVHSAPVKYVRIALGRRKAIGHVR